MPAPPNNSGLRDNHTRGTVADFLRAKTLNGSNLSIVSAYFTIYAYDALKEELEHIEHLDFLFGEPSFVSHGESMRYEGRMMKRGRFSGVFSYFIIHPSTLLSLLRLTADSPDLLTIIKQEGKVLNLTRRREVAKIRQRKQIDFNLLNSFAASRLRVRNRLQPTSP